MAVLLVRLTELPADGLAELVAEAEAGGFRFVRRLVAEWESGEARFDGPGEVLVAAVEDGRVIGVCGLTADPYTTSERVGRVRHLYVAATHRRCGIGRKLVAEVVRAARGRFDLLRLRTNDDAAARFYTALGFIPSDEPDCTNLINPSQAGEREDAMRIVEEKVSSGDHPLFDLGEFLSRPLFAHLAHRSEHGPRESPVWFHWDGTAIWVIGGASFPANLRRDPRCALGIVDFDPSTGLCQHVGMRGTAEILPFDVAVARTIFRRYMGPDEMEWDRRFDDVFDGSAELELVRFTPDTVVVRDQSYRPTRWARERRPV